MGVPQVFECVVQTVDGVELSSVMISWSGPGVSTDRFILTNIIDSGNNTFTRSLRIAYLLESDTNVPYFCIVTILEAGGIESVEFQSLTSKSINVVS